MPIDQAESTRLNNAMLGLAAYPATTSPIRGRLTTTTGTAAAAGTEVVNAGGSAYASQSVTAGLPTSSTNGSVTNSVAAITYTNMPATTVTAIELWDSAATPVRKMVGALTTAKTTALGDSLTFATSQLTVALT